MTQIDGRRGVDEACTGNESRALLSRSLDMYEVGFWASQGRDGPFTAGNKLMATFGTRGNLTH
jgi:hypothetical protein